MSVRPAIFISATAVELKPYRDALKQALLQIGARPVEHEDLTIDYGPLQGVLHQEISGCEAVIHLAGFAYGPEPAERTLGAPRRSFTHYEMDVARTLEKPIYAFLAVPGAKLGAVPPEDEERRQLQREHRAALERSGGFCETFSDPEELARKVRALRFRLIVRRRLAVLPRRPLADQFVPRGRVMSEVMEQLGEGGLTILHPPENLTAHAGTGTTTVATELAWRLHDEARLDFVFYIPAGARADIEASLAALSRTEALALLPDEISGHQVRLDAVLNWFRAAEHAGRWLMILDGADNDSIWWTVRTILPAFARGAVVVTSRRTLWPGLRACAVDAFALEQARDFLLKRLRLTRALSHADRLALDQIAESLQRVPVALEVAAAMLRESGRSPSEFVAEWMPSSAGGKEVRPLSLTLVLERSVAQLDAAAKALLHTLTCLAPQPAAIPLALFEHRGDWPQTSAALAELENRALVVRDDSGRTVSIHRTIREIVRDRLSPTDLSTALASARSAVDAALRRSEAGFGSSGATLRELLVPHCRGLLGQLNGHPLEAHAAQLAQSLAHWLKDIGRPYEAEPFYRRALTIEERNHGPNSPQLIARLRDLASVLRLTHRSRDAEALYRRALTLSEAAHGPEHAEVVPDLSNLAACLRVRGGLEEAERLYRRALAIEERSAGRAHPRVAIVLNRLAGVLEISRQLLEAETLYRRALEIDESKFGATHPRVLLLQHNLAGVLAARRRLPEAEELYRRVLAAEEQKLGPEHPDLAPTLSALACLLEDAGQTAEAEQIYRRVLALHEQTLDPVHEELAVDLTNLAGLLQETGRLADAEALFRRAVQILTALGRRMLGDHPHLASVVKNYAGVLRLMGVSEDEITVCIDTATDRAVAQPGRTALQ